MVNTRSKIKKTQNINKICFSRASIEDTDHQSTQSGASIGSNDDLLTQILLRLPVISILRFKSVSKQWRWLLSDKSFTLRLDKLSKSHGLFLRNKYIPFVVEKPSTPPFRTLDFYFDPCGIRILQSCNGLLLCCSNRGKECVRKYSVFNPTTKQFAMIPSVPGGQNVRKTIRFMGLAFHQTDCVHYKVVCIHSVELNGDLFHIQIYSSETGKWKISSESFFARYFTFKYGAYWNGAIHWAPSRHNRLYFKIEGEQLQTLRLPGKVASSEGATPQYFGESRGHLHLVETTDQENRLHLTVYEMLNDHSEWFVKYQVELDELLDAFPEMIVNYYPPSSPHYYDFNVLDVVRCENEEDTFIVVKVCDKILRYNVYDKSFKKMSNLPYHFHERDINVHCYIETLSPF